MRRLMTKDSIFYLQKEVWDDIKEYKDGFKEVIRKREENRIPFYHQSPQFTYRPHLVEYIKKLCMQRNLSYCCLHLAIYLLDIFMDNHSISPERVLIVANVCLLLAAKFEENTTTIPKISEVNAAINDRYPISDYRDLEIVILNFFHWYLMYPTAAHYTHYYMQAIICYEDIKTNTNTLRTLFYDLHDAITGYLDKVIDNIHYMQKYRPSKLAAAIIAASRIDVGLSSWTNQLENLTDYKKEDFEDALETLIEKKPFTSCPKCNAAKILM